jgi:hypothetical protein
MLHDLTLGHLDLTQVKYGKTLPLKPLHMAVVRRLLAHMEKKTPRAILRSADIRSKFKQVTESVRGSCRTPFMPRRTLRASSIKKRDVSWRTSANAWSSVWRPSSLRASPSDNLRLS